jgi:hypothetical protein
MTPTTPTTTTALPASVLSRPGRGLVKTAVAAGLLTAMLAFAGLAYRATTVSTDPSQQGVPYSPGFRGVGSGPGAMLNAHDGQAFGSLALDPLLSRPTEWGGGRAEMAYRAARPLLGWLVMLTSFGSATAAGWGLLAWTAIGIGVMAAGALVLADHWGRQGDWVPLLLLLPGVVGQIMFGGLSDALATGLALFGLAWWLKGRDRLAIVVLCLAALCRETTLLVTLALFLSLFVAGDRRRAMRLLIPFAAYVGWIGVVWLRVGALPNDAPQGRISVPPGNYMAVVGSWSWVEVASAAIIAVLAIVAWRRAPCRDVRLLVVLSALFAATFSPAVLRSWDFARPLLPVTVVGACLLGRRIVDSAPRSHPPGTVEGEAGPLPPAAAPAPAISVPGAATVS